MLFKLCKMEFKQSWRPFALLYALLLISGVFSGMNGTNAGTLNGIMMLIYMSSIIAVMILVMVNIIRSYYQTMFGRTSYLTHTLPVTSTQLLISKIISGLLWSFVSVFVIFITVLILGLLITRDTGILDNIGYNFDFSIDLEGFVLLLSMLIDYVNGILLIFFVITCVHSSFIRKYRVACAIGLYALINIILSLTLDEIVSNGYYAGIGNSFNIFIGNNLSFTNQTYISIAINLIFCCIYFFATKYFLDHKLEVE